MQNLMLSKVINLKHYKPKLIIFSVLSLSGGKGGGGGAEKKFRYFGGDPKNEWKFSNFHPPPPLINNERSLILKSQHKSVVKILGDSQ